MKAKRRTREKEIYDFALKEKVISDDLYKRLYEMYDYRNRVVHRFNISGIRYADIAEVCTKFEPLYQEVIKVVDVLENGPHGPHEMSKEQHEVRFSENIDKIDHDHLSHRTPGPGGGPGFDRAEHYQHSGARPCVLCRGVRCCR